MTDRTNFTPSQEEGMNLYDRIVNNVDRIEPELPDIIAQLTEKDESGQFLASSARFLAAIDKPRFQQYINELVEAAISKDRERRYIGSLLQALWGEDYMERAQQLREEDDNFRRIYKRIYPSEQTLY
jgi:hypothetical protein